MTMEGPESKREPMSKRAAAAAIARLSLMKYFPSGPDSRAALGAVLMEMCEYADQALWLAKRMSELYSDWPSEHELRAAYCSKYVPRDGREVYSEIYPDGIPSEKPADTPQLPPAPPRGLLTADPALQNEVSLAARHLGRVKRLEAPRAPLPPIPEGKAITPADIERAVRENRRKAAESEIGGRGGE